jgi:leucyl aminopeptidase
MLRVAQASSEQAELDEREYHNQQKREQAKQHEEYELGLKIVQECRKPEDEPEDDMTPEQIEMERQAFYKQHERHYVDESDNDPEDEN